MARMALAEYGERYTESLISEYALKHAFWWDGEWRGEPISCFITGKKAVCKIGDKMALSACLTRRKGVPQA